MQLMMHLAYAKKREYLAFLDTCKTEREFVKEAEESLQRTWFVNIKDKDSLVYGDKVL